MTSTGAKAAITRWQNELNRLRSRQRFVLKLHNLDMEHRQKCHDLQMSQLYREERALIDKMNAKERKR